MPLSASRRLFLKEAAAISAVVTSPRPIHGDSPEKAQTSSTVEIPTADFHGTKITRLLIGSNPLYGYSHFNSLLDRTMREWMTPERRVETLHRAEAAGINTWQVHYNDPTIEDFRRYRDEGGKMHWLLLGDFALMTDWRLIQQMAKLHPLGIAHHGNRTDERFRAGEMHLVRDFVKAVQDAGLPGGVSTHNPQVIAYIEEKGWNAGGGPGGIWRSASAGNLYGRRSRTHDCNGEEDQQALLRLQAASCGTKHRQTGSGGCCVCLRLRKHQTQRRSDCRDVPQVQGRDARER